ncbi:hypothetical protein B0H63DRAFT_447712 [Podospora didyma]|uniref:Uncharacterized protein n=1 Tax=Podospora didyma TaxID=330526 RepID=A0AAE0NSD4_9PEZI|nr:hypothetical protein B0H63DRAFT_447712 [Podospora didyma]
MSGRDGSNTLPRVRRILFTTTSHDQGYSGDPERQGTYLHSHTFFDVHVVEPSGHDRVPPRTLQFNMHARRAYRTHINCWDYRDAEYRADGDPSSALLWQSLGLSLQDWLQSIRNGDSVQIVPRVGRRGVLGELDECVGEDLDAMTVIAEQYSGGVAAPPPSLPELRTTHGIIADHHDAGQGSDDIPFYQMHHTRVFRRPRFQRVWILQEVWGSAASEAPPFGSSVSRSEAPSWALGPDVSGAWWGATLALRATACPYLASSRNEVDLDLLSPANVNTPQHAAACLTLALRGGASRA